METEAALASGKSSKLKETPKLKASMLGLVSLTHFHPSVPIVPPNPAHQ
jgi:hypothetical protein